MKIKIPFSIIYLVLSQIVLAAPQGSSVTSFPQQQLSGPFISNALKPKSCHTAYNSADMIANQQVTLPGREEQLLNDKVDEYSANGLIPPPQFNCPDKKEIQYVPVPVHDKVSSYTTSVRRSAEILPETHHSLPLPRLSSPIGVISNGHFVMCNLNRLAQPLQNDPEALSSYLVDAGEPLKSGIKSDCDKLVTPTLEVQEKIKQLKINEAIVTDKLKDTTLSDYDRYRLTAKQSQIKALEYQMSRCAKKSTMLDDGSVPLGAATTTSATTINSIDESSNHSKAIGKSGNSQNGPSFSQNPQNSQNKEGFFSKLEKSDIGKFGKIYAGNVAMNALMGGRTPFSTGAMLTSVGAHNGGLGTSSGKGAFDPAVMNAVQMTSNYDRRHHNHMGYGNGGGINYHMGGPGGMMMGGPGGMMMGGSGGMMMGGGQMPMGMGMPMGSSVMINGGLPQMQPLPGMIDPSLMPGLEMTPGLISYEMNRRDRDAKAMIYDQDSANAMAVRQINRAPNMIGNQMNQMYNQAIMNSKVGSNSGSVIRTPFGKIDGKLMYARQIEAMGSPVYLQTNPSLIYGEDETDLIRNQYKQASKCRNAIY